jgi:predicted RNase H-like HicB family nuclease
MPHYIALIRKDSDSDFGVDFPDFPGCITAGRTMDEARKLAVEALSFHVRGLLEDGELLPHPTTLEKIMADPSNRDTAAFLVTISDTRRRRVNITIPETDLESIDAYVKRHNLSRSAFLVLAAKKAMEVGAM